MVSYKKTVGEVTVEYTAEYPSELEVVVEKMWALEKRRKTLDDMMERAAQRTRDAAPKPVPIKENRRAK